jgi:hypothetical protein
MQFNHPEILVLLVVLIIPILIHLFQLQRFKKEAFTNVKFLREIELQSRKSSRIKKLLILASRLLALTCLILAFAQPVLKKTDGQENRKTILYLDNSLSMQATDKNGSELLQNAKRVLIDELQSLPGDFALITNDNIRESMPSEGMRQELTKISYHPVRKDFSQIILEAQTISANKGFDGADVFLFSDFRHSPYEIDSLPSGGRNRFYLIPVRSDRYQNLSLDSIWLSAYDRNELKIKGRVLAQDIDEDNLSVSLVLNGQLYGKSSLAIDKDNYANVEFSIPPETSGNGAMIFSDPRLGFDNSLFFTLPQAVKPKVLVIGAYSSYIERIYTSDSFELSFQELSNLNQGGIQDYDLVLLNELDEVPMPLVRSLKAYVQEIGNLVLIPSAQPDLASYQSMFGALGIGRVSSEFERKKSIISVSDDHPFFSNVFKGEVKNFEYPEANYGIESDFKSSASLISFDDGSAFASEIPIGKNRVFWIASPLQGEQSNFRESPLIVPLFYNFSLPENRAQGIYSIIGRSNVLRVRHDSLSGNALKITNGKEEYIPLQKNSAQQVELFTKDYPLLPGIYQIVDNERVLSEHAFNYDRNLIRQDYANLKRLAEGSSQMNLLSSPGEGLRALNDLFSSRSLWQLFTIFALIFLVLEMLIQKFFKN